MIIQIDTDNLSENDSFFLSLLLLDRENLDPNVPVPFSLTEQGESDKPAKPTGTRSGRRNKQQIAYDESLDRYHVADAAGDGSEYKALQEAAEELAARDPEDERLAGYAQIVTEFKQAEPTAGSENADSDSAAKVTDEDLAAEDDSPANLAVSVQDVTELAAKLIAADRPAMIELLKGLGVRRVSEVPQAKYGELTAAIQAKLA